MENVEKEVGRISALKQNKYNSKKNMLETYYFAQVEIIEYEAYSGDEIKLYFVTDTNKSFNSELSALKYAMKYRDEISRLI